MFDYLIATDASIDRGEEDEDSDGENEADESGGLEGLESTTREKKAAVKKPKKSSADKGDDGYGVSRGIDFKGVNFVINFDFPLTAAAYTHRIGRTARGNASGTALSFVTKIDPKEVLYIFIEIVIVMSYFSIFLIFRYVLALFLCLLMFSFMTEQRRWKRS